MLIRKVRWKAANILINRIFLKKRKTVIPQDTCLSPLSNSPAFSLPPLLCPISLLSPLPSFRPLPCYVKSPCFLPPSFRPLPCYNHLQPFSLCPNEYSLASPVSRAHKVLKGQGLVCHFNRFNTST